MFTNAFPKTFSVYSSKARGPHISHFKRAHRAIENSCLVVTFLSQLVYPWSVIFNFTALLFGNTLSQVIYDNWLLYAVSVFENL